MSVSMYVVFTLHGDSSGRAGGRVERGGGGGGLTTSDNQSANTQPYTEDTSLSLSLVSLLSMSSRLYTGFAKWK